MIKLITVLNCYINYEKINNTYNNQNCFIELASKLFYILNTENIKLKLQRNLGFQITFFSPHPRNEFVRTHPLFANWSYRHRKQMSYSLKKEKVQFNEYITKQGQQASAIYFLLK